MALDILRERGTALEDQQFDWRDLVREPYSKLEDDAFTRMRVMLMSALEAEALRFSHACARMNSELAIPLARVRRIEQHQQTLVSWLTPSDQSALETSLGLTQLAVEVTASVAQNEPDAYLRQVYEFGLLEDLDHLYRYAALMSRLDGPDPDTVLKDQTDVRPGRPTSDEHRAPEDDLRRPYDRFAAYPISKIDVLTILACKHRTRDHAMFAGPTFSDPSAKRLYAEIASVEEQHVTQYESLADPEETWLEKWLLHEMCEVYNYHSCLIQETNPRLASIWERFVDYELGHLHYVMHLFERIEGRDPAEILPASLPTPLDYSSQRAYVREVLRTQVDLRARGRDFVPLHQDSAASIARRARLNRDGSPSEEIAAGYRI